MGADGRTRESERWANASAGGCAGGCDGGGGGGGGSSSSTSSGSSGSGDDERVLALPLLAAASIATQLLARLLGRPSKASPPSLIDTPPMPAITAALAASRTHAGDHRRARRLRQSRSCGGRGTGSGLELRRCADEADEYERRRVAAVGAFFEEKKLSAASGTFTVAPGIALQTQASALNAQFLEL